MTERVGPIVFAAIIALLGADPTVAGEADVKDPALVERGREVYARHCASCHGADLEGQPNWQYRRADGKLPAPPHNADGHTWHHPDAVLFTMTAKGPEAFAGPAYPSDMPAFEEVLTKRDIWAVLAFIKSQWPPPIQGRQELIDQQARQE